MDQSLDIWDLLRGMWARKILMFFTFIFLMTGAVFFTMTASPRYTSELRIIIENEENQFTNTEDTREQREVTEQEIVSQVQVLLSRDLATRVADALDLGQYPEFDPVLRGLSAKDRILIRLGLKTDPTLLTAEQRVTDAYFDKLSVHQIDTSRVVAVQFTSSESQLAADVANTVGETYVQATRELKYDLAADALNWLSAEIARLRIKVAESEAAVEEFRAASGLLGSDTQTLTAQELSGINEQIILAAAARSEAQARARAIQEQLERTGDVNSSTDVLNSQVIQNLREQQVVLQRQVAELSTTYLSSHPSMVSLNAEIENLSREIRSEALKIVNALEEEARVQGAREAALRASLAELASQESQNNQEEITLRALEREAAANRDLLQTFLERFSEASARQDILALPPGARIISRAQALGVPSWPKKLPMVLLGFAGSVTMALLLAFSAEAFSSGRGSARTRIPSPAPSEDLHEPEISMAGVSETDIELPSEPELEAAQVPPELPSQAEPQPQPLPQLGPILQEIPPTGAESGQISAAASEAVRDPTSEFSVAIRRLTQKLRDERNDNGTKRFLWTCAQTTGDKAVILSNLARSFALSGSKVIVVDADSSSDHLAEAFQLTPGPGLSELIAGDMSFTDVILKDAVSSVHFLRLGATGEMTEHAFKSPRFGYVLDALDHAYEVVLINTGPILSPGDASVAEHAQYGVIVVQGTREGARAGAQVQQTLTNAGVAKVVAIKVQTSGMFDRLLGRNRRAA